LPGVNSPAATWLASAVAPVFLASSGHLRYRDAPAREASTLLAKQQRRSLVPHQISDRMQECIDRCQSCQETCLESVPHCLELGGKHAERDHISMLIACAEICDTSARFMLLGSAHHARTCEVCAEVCDACAKDCERLGDDDTMKHCAEACRRCAESCRQMAKTAA
jgi:hypothetical protein